MKKFDFKKIGMRVGGVAAGAVAGELVNKVGFIGNMKPALRGGLKIIVGAVIPELMPKQAFVGHIGDGMIAAGAIDTYNGLTSKTDAPVEGIGDQFTEDQFVVDNDYDVNGIEDPISGINDNPMGGVEDDDYNNAEEQNY